MPVMDGYEATCIIRDDMHITTPIIAMTAHALTGEKEKCFEQGINDYLPKPFSEDDLLRKIAQWIDSDNIKNTATPAREIKITDLAFLNKQTRDNADLIREMSDMFITQNPQEIQELETAIARGDHAAIYKKAHSLRNSTSLFGLAPHIGEALLSMEKSALNFENTETIKTGFLKVREYCDRAVTELKTR